MTPSAAFCDDRTLPAIAVGVMAPPTLASTVKSPATSIVTAPTDVAVGGSPIRAVTSRLANAIAVLTPTVFAELELPTPATGIR